MARQKGQWAKVTGGDAGAWFDGRKWQPFECIGCMFALGILKPSDRLQLADVASFVGRALKNRANNPNYIKHQASNHRVERS